MNHISQRRGGSSVLGTSHGVHWGAKGKRFIFCTLSLWSYLPFLQFSDFRFNYDQTKRARKPKASGDCHQYVPYSSFTEHELPKFMDITNNEKRVYLKHQFNRNTGQNQDKSGFADLHPTYDSKRYLDLGVAPLQRIINDLRSITSQTVEDFCDHRAAKSSGLASYTEYLQGAGRKSSTWLVLHCCVIVSAFVQVQIFASPSHWYSFLVILQ